MMWKYKTAKIKEFRTADKRTLVSPDKELQAINNAAILNNITKTEKIIRRNSRGER